VVISDFESWSYLYGVNHGLPVISVDNIQIVNRCQHDKDVIAGHEASFQIAKGIVKAKVPGAYQYLITTFSGRPSARSAPPCIRRSCGPRSWRRRPRRARTCSSTSRTPPTRSCPISCAGPGIECRIYGLRRDLQEEERDGNLAYKPFSEQGFIDDLRTARAWWPAPDSP